MARYNAIKARRLFARFLEQMNQQKQSVYLVRVNTAQGGDKLAFGVGGTRTITKLLLSPSPLVEDLSTVREERLGTPYLAGDMQVNFVPPLKGNGTEHTIAELETYTEVWFGPLTGSGTPNERPASRLYIRKTSAVEMGGIIVSCAWIGNPSQPRA